MLVATLTLGAVASCDTDGDSDDTQVVTTSTATQVDETEESSEDETEEETGSGTTGEVGNVSLRITWWGNQVRNDGTIAMMDAFVEANPNIEYSAEFVDWSGYWDRLATQIASQTLPDIVQQDNQYVGQYHSRGLMLNLDEFVDSGVLDISDVNDSILQTGMFDGELYALTAGMNALCLIYNPRVAEEAGLEVPLRFNYEDLMSMNAQVYEATGKVGVIPAGIPNLQMLARDMGEQIFDHENNQIGASEETLLIYFNHVKDTIESDWSMTVDQIQEDSVAGVENSALPVGTSWNAIPGGSNQLDAIQSSAGEELELAMYPTLSNAKEESMYLRPSQFWSISSSSEHPEEAAMVIDFFTNAEEAQDILMAERGVPVASDMREYLTPKVSDVQRKIFEYIGEVEKVAEPFDPPYPAGGAEVTSILDDLTDLIRYGEITPDDAVTRFISEANDALARAAE